MHHPFSWWSLVDHARSRYLCELARLKRCEPLTTRPLGSTTARSMESVHQRSGAECGEHCPPLLAAQPDGSTGVASSCVFGALRTSQIGRTLGAGGAVFHLRHSFREASRTCNVLTSSDGTRRNLSHGQLVDPSLADDDGEEPCCLPWPATTGLLRNIECCV